MRSQYDPVSEADRPAGEAQAYCNTALLLASAVLLATEGAMLGVMGEDARRLILSRMVMDHRLRAADPMAIEENNDAAVAALLSEDKVDLATAQTLAA